MNSETCCIFNLAPHYRAPIFKLMDEELKCHFYFGDTLNSKIKLIDYSTLKGFQKEVKNVPLKKYGFMWQKGVWQLIFKPYKNYIITGAPSMLSSWVLLVLAKLTGKKVYAWTHGLKKPVKSNGDLFQKIFFKLCHRILLYGDYSKGVMLNEGFKEESLVPIYNSLDYSLQLKIRQSLHKTSIFTDHFKNNNPTIIYIGRIQKTKKLDHLIKAIHLLKLENIFCNLVFVGSDVENNNLSEFVSKHKLQKNVWFYGPLYDEKIIANMLFNAALCVSPGPVGLTALHSLTYGCPVISNDDFQNQMPEHEAIIVDKTGNFFKNNDISNLAEKIKQWAFLSSTQRDNVRKEAYQIIDSKWNPTFQIDTLKKVLN